MYEATIIIANPAQTMPKTLAEKLRGVPVIKICQIRRVYVKKIDNYPYTFLVSKVAFYVPMTDTNFFLKQGFVKLAF